VGAELVDRAGKPLGSWPLRLGSSWSRLVAGLLELLAVVLELAATQPKLPGGDECATEHRCAGKALKQGGTGVAQGPGSSSLAA
jgi:hypothetical protein